MGFLIGIVFGVVLSALSFLFIADPFRRVAPQTPPTEKVEQAVAFTPSAKMPDHLREPRHREVQDMAVGESAFVSWFQIDVCPNGDVWIRKDYGTEPTRDSYRNIEITRGQDGFHVNASASGEKFSPSACYEILRDKYYFVAVEVR